MPRYAEIRAEIEGRIRSGEWPPGRRIPSEHDLMGLYGCSRMTVHKALSALAETGLIVRKRRSGSFVAMPATEEAVLEIHDIEAEITATGRAYGYELLGRHIRPATAEDAERLRIPPGGDVLALQALHVADRYPFALELRLINLGAVPDARGETFAEAPSGTWLLRRIPWTEAEHSIRAIPASQDIASRLDTSRSAACLLVERRTWQSGVPITFVQLVYPGDRHQLVGRFGPGAPADRDA